MSVLNFLLHKQVAIAKRNFPLSKVYRLLEPGPVVLITTAYQGRTNIMTQSWHTMMEFEPPLVGYAFSVRNYSFDALAATKECENNIPVVNLAMLCQPGMQGGRYPDGE